MSNEKNATEMMVESVMAERKALARSVLEACKSEEWRRVFRPYIERERDNAIKAMAGLTDPLQLMRYAGAMQALNSLMEMDDKAKTLITESIEKHVQQFKN